MNPPLTFADAKVQLNLFTSQTGNFTFTDDEITQALQMAWNDTYVVTSVWDNSLSYDPTIFQYTLPSTVGVVQGLYFQRTSTDNPEPLGRNLYDVQNNTIIFNNNATRWLGDTYPIYIKGRYKLLTTDSLPTNNLVNYVINVAAEQLLSNLVLKKTFVFLRNDTSLGDIANAIRVIQGRTLTYKQALLREFEAI